MLTGVVKGFRKDKRFGSISSGGTDYFLHEKYMQKGEQIPEAGDVVEFKPFAVKSTNPRDRDLALQVRIVARATR